MGSFVGDYRLRRVDSQPVLPVFAGLPSGEETESGLKNIEVLKKKAPLSVRRGALFYV
jgi:hypothetical protein